MSLFNEAVGIKGKLALVSHQKSLSSLGCYKSNEFARYSRLLVRIALLSIALTLKINCWSGFDTRDSSQVLEEPAPLNFIHLVAGQPTSGANNRHDDNNKKSINIESTLVDVRGATTLDEAHEHEYRQSGSRNTATAKPPTTTSTPTTTIRSKVDPNSNSQSARLTIETAVFLDHALSSRYASMSQGLADLNELVLSIMNQVKHMFSYSSLMIPIDIKLVLIESFKDSERRNLMPHLPNPELGDIDLYLANFCQWQQARLEEAMARESLWWDHAILLSGLDLYKASRKATTTATNINSLTRNESGILGLSWVGGMCKRNYSCSVGEAINLESAFVIAHEIGHSLGMMHDGNRNNCDPNKFIMSDKTGAGKVNWSRCSNNYLSEALRRQQLNCLSQNSSLPGSTDPMYDLSKLKDPGQVYDLNDQCKLAYGNNYSPLTSYDTPYSNVCQELWCVSGSWARPVHPALEGSSCERQQDQPALVCREGKCES